MTYYISDTHFYHSKIIDGCNRPFKNIIEMNKELIKNWNKIVRKNDIVWFLGDLSFADKEKTAKIVAKLNGRINMVMGNHDNLSVLTYYQMGFKYVSKYPIIVDDKYLLSHEPMKQEKGSKLINIYGHVHDRYEYEDSNNICVCVEKIGYKPIMLDKTTREKSYE